MRLLTLSCLSVALSAWAPAQPPQTPARAGAALREQEVLITGPAGRRLAGTLTLPATGHGPFPAALTLTGSGAHFRDGNRTPGHPYRPFRQIAAALAARGVACLRLDDRGVGGSSGDAQAATGDDVAADARLALAWLRARADVAPERLALIGHSFGGEVAPLVAADDARVAALVLMGAPARNFRETMRYQHRDRIENDAAVAPGQREAALAEAMRQQERNVAASVEKWRQWSQDRDPLATARRVRCPVLILQGLTDRAVQPEDARLLEQALRGAGNAQVSVRLFESVNHHFQQDPSGAREGYDRLPTQDLAPEFLEALAAWLARTLSPSERQIAVTLDDLPFVGARTLAEAQAGTLAILDALRAHAVPAIGFVNEDKLLVPGEVDERIGLLEAWLAAGLELGNHNFGHVGFQDTPLAGYEEAVLKGEVVTRYLLARRGRAPRYYRHTFTQTGPTAADRTAFEAFLAAHGYAVAPFTIEHDDFVFAGVYADALAQGDSSQAARVRDAYLAHLDPALDTFESMAQDLFARPIPQVLLIHANALNAASLDALLARLEQRGYRFVSLEDALKDPAYVSPDGYIGPYGPSWLRRWSLGLGRPTRLKGQPDPPAWITERGQVLH